MKIINSQVLKSHGNIEGRSHILDMLDSGLKAADPYFNTKKLMRVENDQLHIGYGSFIPTGAPQKKSVKYDLGRDLDRIFVFGAGKGIQRVAKAIEEILGEHLTGGLIILKHGDDADILERIEVACGGHPIPDIHCVEACNKLVDSIKVARLTDRDLVFTIFGNGASSLLTLPADGLSLDEIKKVTQILQIEKGLPTIKINYVRTQLDQLKGGRVTRMLTPAKMVHIVPIDLNEPNSFGVPGYEGCTNANIWIHSLPDMGSIEKAIEVLKENDTWELVPVAVREFFLHSNPQNDVLTLEEFERMNCMIFGIMPTEMSFIPATMQKAEELGYTPHFLMRRTLVEARSAGVLVSQIARNVEDTNKPFPAPCALVLTGELVVAVENEDGIGGRNQEFALSAASIINGSQRIVVGAVDTDGTDGPGGCFNKKAAEQGCDNLAGGIVDGYTFMRARQLGIDIDGALKTHGTSNVLWELDSGIWATQNISVQDLIVVLIMDHDG